MKVELTPEAARWVETELAAGHFATAEDAIEAAVITAKLTGLREELAAAISNPHRYTMDQVKNHLAAKRAELIKEGF